MSDLGLLFAYCVYLMMFVMILLLVFYFLLFLAQF